MNNRRFGLADIALLDKSAGHFNGNKTSYTWHSNLQAKFILNSKTGDKL